MILAGKNDPNLFAVYDAETTNTSFSAKRYAFLRTDASTNTIYPAGYINFEYATIPYFLVIDVTSTSISINISNVKRDDLINVLVRKIDEGTTHEVVNYTITDADDEELQVNLNNLPANTEFSVGVKVNGWCIGFQTVKTKVS